MSTSALTIGNVLKISFQHVNDSILPCMRVEGNPHGIPGLLESPSKPPDFVFGTTTVVTNFKFRRLNVTEDRDNLLPAFHNKSQLVKTKIWITVVWGKYCDPDLTISYPFIYLLKQLVTRFHALAIKKSSNIIPWKAVVKQPRHIMLCVDSSVVDEDVAGAR